jgi:hypothetical protein
MDHIGRVDFQLKIRKCYRLTPSIVTALVALLLWATRSLSAPSLALIGFRKLAACRVARVYLHSLCGTMIMVQVLRFTYIFIYFILSGPLFGILYKWVHDTNVFLAKVMIFLQMMKKFCYRIPSFLNTQKRHTVQIWLNLFNLILSLIEVYTSTLEHPNRCLTRL